LSRWTRAERNEQDGGRALKLKVESSDPFDGEVRIEPTEITDVASHDDRALAPSGQDHGRVDHVRCPRAPTEDADRLRQKLIERGNLRGGSREQGPQRYLPGSIAPDLTNHASRDDQSRVCSKRFAAERAHARIPLLERDERSCV
jgi:hypothetical protein